MKDPRGIEIEPGCWLAYGVRDGDRSDTRVSEVVEVVEAPHPWKEGSTYTQVKVRPVYSGDQYHQRRWDLHPPRVTVLQRPEKAFVVVLP